MGIPLSKGLLDFLFQRSISQLLLRGFWPWSSLRASALQCLRIDLLAELPADCLELPEITSLVDPLLCSLLLPGPLLPSSRLLAVLSELLCLDYIVSESCCCIYFILSVSCLSISVSLPPFWWVSLLFEDQLQVYNVMELVFWAFLPLSYFQWEDTYLIKMQKSCLVSWALAANTLFHNALINISAKYSVCSVRTLGWRPKTRLRRCLRGARSRCLMSKGNESCIYQPQCLSSAATHTQSICQGFSHPAAAKKFKVTWQGLIISLCKFGPYICSTLLISLSASSSSVDFLCLIPMTHYCIYC